MTIKNISTKALGILLVVLKTIDKVLNAIPNWLLGLIGMAVSFYWLTTDCSPRDLHIDLYLLGAYTAIFIYGGLLDMANKTNKCLVQHLAEANELLDQWEEEFPDA